MKRGDFWDFAFVSVLAMRFHPRNTVKDTRGECEFAAAIADIATLERDKRVGSEVEPIE